MTARPHSIPSSPVCDGEMEVVCDRYNQIVVVCVDCHTGLTVPSSAWETKRLKDEGKWVTQADRNNL